ncbi:MAG: hypothetical protein ACPG49_10510 [Chitinophagales bacterium]
MGAKNYWQSVRMDEEISKLRVTFEQLKDTRASNSHYTFADICMSGYVMFALKHPSMLSFKPQTKAERINLKTVFSIEKLPSDTQLRTVLDTIDPTFFRDELSEKLGLLRKTGIVKEFGYRIGGQTYHLLSLQENCLHVPSTIDKLDAIPYLLIHLQF